MGIGNFLLGALQVLAGIFLTATGLGAGLGLKLILSGALTIITGLITPQGRDGFSSSPRYGFDNVRNTTNEGGPIPVIYGREMVAPAIISQMIEPDGLDQRLKVLCLIGEGTISAITDIRLNDTPIDEFDGIQVQKWYGTDPQYLSWGWRDIGTAYAAGTRLGLNDVHTHTGKGEVDALVLSLTFPGGLYGVHKDGGLAYAGFNCRIEWARGSNPKATDWKPVVPARWQQKSVGGYWSGQVRTTTGWIHNGGNWWTVAAQRTQSAYRIQMRVDLNQFLGNAGRDVFSIRITGAEAVHGRRTNIPTVVNVVEVQTELKNYENRALLGLIIPATAQLSGGTPKITCLVDGLKVEDPRTASSSKVWSRNPVLCARDLLTSERYGLGEFFSSSDLDEGVGGTWRTMADYCDVALQGPGYSQPHHRHQLDLVLDVKAPLRDWLTQILTTARLNLFQSDGLLRLSADQDSASVRAFTEDEGDGVRKGILAAPESSGGRMVSSLVDRMLPDSQAWTTVRARYVDRFKDYQQQVVEITDDRIPVDGVIVGGPFLAGETLRASGSYTIVYSYPWWGFTWRYTRTFTWTGFLSRNYETGDPYVYVAPDDDTAAWPSKYELNFPVTLTGLSSKATTGATGHLDEAGPERVAEIQLYGVTRMVQALREARFHINRAQLTPRFCSFAVTLGDLDLEPGDVFSIDSARLGWSGKLWMCLGTRYGHDGTGRVEAREHDPDVYLDQTDHIKDPVLYKAPGGAITPGSRSLQAADSNQKLDQATKPGLSKAASGKDAGAKAAQGGKAGSSGKITGRKPVSKARNVWGRSGRLGWTWLR